MKCPTCDGKGKIVGVFPVWAENVKRKDRKPAVFIGCYRCNGDGEVPDEAETWMKMGKELREQRIAQRWTLRRASKELGIDVSVICNMEGGVVEPNMNLYEGIEDS